MRTSTRTGLSFFIFVGFVGIGLLLTGLWLQFANDPFLPSVPWDQSKDEPAISQLTSLVVPTHTPTSTRYPPTPTLAPTLTHTPTRTLTPTPTLTLTPLPQTETFAIGQSVLGRAITVTRLGSGPHAIVFVGAPHGTEANAASLVDGLIEIFIDSATALPPEVTLYFVPRLNPDGLNSASRYNANGIDLNRNWNTNNWQRDTQGPNGMTAGAGGAFPFSEPETAALSNFLLELRNQSANRPIVIIYHSAYPPSGLVQPGYRIVNGVQQTDSESAALASVFASQLDYGYSPTWTDYAITGEAIHWCAENDITCFDVELPTHDDLTESQQQSHFLAIADMITR